MSRFRTILFVSKIYLLVVSLFFLFRVILFISEIDRVDLLEVSVSDILKAFVMGVRFDVVISGYILLLPALALFVADLFNFRNKLFLRVLFFWIFGLFSIAFLISSADIQYFNQFFSRFSITALEWTDNAGFIAKMILQEPKYFAVIVLFLLVVVAFYKGLSFLFRSVTEPSKASVTVRSSAYLLFLFLMCVGVRGRIEKKSPIRIGTAYFSNDAFLNQLGLNPVFTFMRSYFDSKDVGSITLIDEQVAVTNVRSHFSINSSKYQSPIAREVLPDTAHVSKPNVVLIIMESMSAAKLNRHGNENNLTPFIDSLAHRSMYFENIYTSGMHTFNGIFSTITSYPALYRQHPMKNIDKYNSISNSLREHDYRTIYFTTHDGQFDNVEGFLRANDFETVISKSDYPASEVKTTLGVPDDFMFRFAMPILDKMNQGEQPFFAAFMTASDHGPYYIPDYFKPRSSTIKQQITEYADWSLQKFISSAAKTSWFENTIFVFVADHGAALDVTYDLPLNYFHTPLIFYAPDILEPTIHECIGGQIDVYPTLMGMLKLPYINNTLGIDLLNEERPYIYVNGDDKIGVLDTEHLLILKRSNDNLPELYAYRSGDKTNYADRYPEKANSMGSYARSHLQVFQYMLDQKLLYEESSLNFGN